MPTPPILVTGAAGFIGYHLSQRLLAEGRSVVGIDNLNAYYEVSLKQARLGELMKHPGFQFEKLDLIDNAGMRALFARHGFTRVYNLAAQAGVRHSIDYPQDYVSANVEGFVTLLECCRHGGVGHLIYASSSSVYGAGGVMPFSVHQNVDHPLSVYAATKKANELLAHAYANLFALPSTGVRFFTVYGPWGRPDMALFLFTRAILAGEPIRLFDHGRMRRDFTYIDDIVEGLMRLCDRPAAPNPHWTKDRPDPATSFAPYRIYNIGNHTPIEINRLIGLLEENLGQKAIRENLPMQPGEMAASFADVGDLQRDVDFAPRTPVETGVKRFIEWYRGYYRV